MVLYTGSFLAFILGLVPYGFHRLGLVLLPGVARQIHPTSLLLPWIGVAVFALGLIGYLICSCWLMIVGKGPHVEFDPPTRFVATGPYRWMRNPVAALLIVTVVGEAIYFASPGILLLVLIGLPLAHLQVTRIEEPRLRMRFGESYEDYCRRVPRWLPKRPKS